eukprot:tig00000093_g3465.t1
MSDDSSSISDSSDEADEQTLPAVKFKRLGVSGSLADDAATCITAHAKFLAVGTQKGRVLVVDTEEGLEIKRINAHTGPVRDISVDDAGEHIASCSDSGKVAVHGLYTDSRNEFTFGQAVLTVALDPDYTRKRTAVVNVGAATQVYSGGAAGQLVVTSKGFLGWKDAALQAADGPVQLARWRGTVLAWAAGTALRFLDTRRRAPRPRAPPTRPVPRGGERAGGGGRAQERALREIDLPEGPAAAAAALAWDAGGAHLVASAGSRVLLDREGSSLPAGSPLLRYPEVVASFDAGAPLVGACPFGDELVAALTAEPTPRLRLRPRAGGPAPGEDGVEVDALRAGQAGGGGDGGGAGVRGVGAEVLLAGAAGAADRVDWLLARGRPEEALRAAEADPRALSDDKARLRFAAVGDALIASLLERGAGEEAAAALPGVCGGDAGRWERHARALLEAGHGLAAGEALPADGPASPPRAVYDDCLLAALEAGEHARMAAWLRRWAPDRVTPRRVLPRALEALKEEPEGGGAALAEAACLLHERAGEHATALELLLRPGARPRDAPDPFAYIAKHGLHEAVRPLVAALFDFDGAAALAMLVAERRRHFPPEAAAEQLAARPAALHAYLAALFEADPGALPAPLHGRLVELLAEHDPAALERFLRASSLYPLEPALEACRRRGLLRPQVFLLGRMGDSRAALGLLVGRLRDVPGALAFVEAQGDDPLWDDLVSQCLAAPEPEELVGRLLDEIGSYTDPLRLVARIPPGLALPGLHLRLAKILADHSAQAALQEGAAAVIKQDTLNLFHSVLRERKRGVRVGVAPRHAAASAAAEGPHATVCALCGAAAGPSRGTSLAVFFCGHAYHHGCIRAACEEQPRGKGKPSPGPGAAEDRGGEGLGAIWCVECESGAHRGASGALYPAVDIP